MHPVRSVPIVLDRPRSLRLDMTAMSLAESVLGLNFMKDASVFDNMRLWDVQVLLWACLTHEDESLFSEDPVEQRRLVRQVGHWIGPSNMEEVTGKVTEAIAVAMPEPEPTGNGARPKNARRAPPEAQAPPPPTG